MEIHAAVAKINKYSTSESGDTLEIVERPNGGISIVLADGQTSGKGAKTVSTMVVRKVISLLAEGVRDGACARAASDYFLQNARQSDCHIKYSLGRSPDRNDRHHPQQSRAGLSWPVMTGSNASPARVSPLELHAISALPLQNSRLKTELPSLCIPMAFATQVTGPVNPWIFAPLLKRILEDQDPSAQELADTILSQAIRMDNNLPNDDMSVVVLRTQPAESTKSGVCLYGSQFPQCWFHPKFNSFGSH